jgi:hypothetical protein
MNNVERATMGVVIVMGAFFLYFAHAMGMRHASEPGWFPFGVAALIVLVSMYGLSTRRQPSMELPWKKWLQTSLAVVVSGVLFIGLPAIGLALTSFICGFSIALLFKASMRQRAMVAFSWSVVACLIAMVLQLPVNIFPLT